MNHRWMMAIIVPGEVVACDCGMCDSEVQIFPLIGPDIVASVDVSGTDAMCVLCKKPFKEAYGTDCDAANTILSN